MSHISTPSSSTTTTTPTSSAAAVNSFATITSDGGATPTSMPFGKAVESVDVCVETGKIAVGCSSLTGDSWEGSISVHFNGRTRTWNCGGGVSCVRWYDATHLLTADDASTVSLWCPDDSSQWGHAEHDDIVSRVSVHPNHDQKAFLTSSWDGTGHAEHDDIVSRVSVHPNHDQKAFLTSSWDGTIKLWSGLKKNSLFTFTGHASSVLSVEWCPTDVNLLVSASQDFTVKIWDSRKCSGCTTTIPLKTAGFSARFDPENANIVLCGEEKGTIKFYDLRNLRSGPVLSTQVSGAVREMEFAPSATQRKINTTQSRDPSHRLLAVADESGAVSVFATSVERNTINRTYVDRTHEGPTLCVKWWDSNLLSGSRDKSLLKHTIC
ncbi:methylosome protein 50 [Pelomyxa schiedti]|nr:methylosome protein 50 [Pelomyxa schiedti]